MTAAPDPLVARMAELESENRELRRQAHVRVQELRDKCRERDALMLRLSDQSRRYEAELRALRADLARFLNDLGAA